MSRTPRWIVHELTGLVLVSALVASCSAERAAPSPTRPQGPAATIAADADADADADGGAAPGPTVPGSMLDTAAGRDATTTVPTVTTTPGPPPIPAATWQEFDAQLAVGLLGRGDLTASVAISVNGEIVHTGAYGARVPPPPPVPGAAPTTTPPTTTPPTTTVPATTAAATAAATAATAAATTTTSTPPPTTVARRSTARPGAVPAGPTTTTDARTTPVGASTTAATTSTAATTTTAATTSTAATTTTTTTPRRPSTTTSTSTTLAPGEEDVEVSDRFRIASISKIVTAIVVLQLVEAGELDLDDPVGADVAAELGATIADPAVGTITVRHLLSHTSGLGVYEGTFFGGRVGSCREAGVRGLSGGLDAPPGTTYRYSNMNYCLLGLLIEQVTGKDYQTVVTDQLLDPLGITGMRLAGTFDPDPDEVQHPSVPNRNYMETLGAAGAWMASAGDIVTIVDSLDPSAPGWHPLGDPTLDLMRRPVAGAAYPRVDERWYGLGLMAFADGTWGHTGTIENAHAMVLHRPDGVTWCILVNGEYPSNTGDLRRIFDESVAAADLPLG